jgi:hypothetical protein
MAASTRYPAAAKAPVPAPLTGANAARSGPCSPTPTASPSGGRPLAPTAKMRQPLLEPTVAAVNNRWLLAECETLRLDRGCENGVVRRLVANVGIDDLICSKVRRAAAPRPGSSCRSGCAGPSTDLLVAVELRAAPPRHRPRRRAPPHPSCPRHRPAHHSQAHRLAQPMKPSLTPIRARAKAWAGDHRMPSDSAVRLPPRRGDHMAARGRTTRRGGAPPRPQRRDPGPHPCGRPGRRRGRG